MFLKIAQKGKNDLGLYIATVILVILGYFIGQAPITIAMFTNPEAKEMSPAELQSAAEKLDFQAFGLSQNMAMFLLLWTFIFAMFVLWICVRKMHKKNWKDILTSRPKLDWSRVFFSFGLWFGLTMIFELIFYFQNPDNYSFQFQPQAFLVLAIIALVLLPIQTSFEEIFFRGFLLQGLSLGAKSRLVPLIITSVAF